MKKRHPATWEEPGLLPASQDLAELAESGVVLAHPVQRLPRGTATRAGAGHLGVVHQPPGRQRRLARTPRLKAALAASPAAAGRRCGRSRRAPRRWWWSRPLLRGREAEGPACPASQAAPSGCRGGRGRAPGPVRRAVAAGVVGARAWSAPGSWGRLLLLRRRGRRLVEPWNCAAAVPEKRRRQGEGERAKHRLPSFKLPGKKKDSPMSKKAELRTWYCAPAVSVAPAVFSR